MRFKEFKQELVEGVYDPIITSPTALILIWACNENTKKIDVINSRTFIRAKKEHLILLLDAFIIV